MSESSPPAAPGAVSPAPPSPIVVGVDGSAESLYALGLAATLGGPHRATLVVVHVRPHPTALGFSPAASAEYAEAQAAQLEALTAEVAARLAGHGGAWSIVVRDGHAAHELHAVADEVDAGLIVVGRRSHGPRRDVMLGSVAAATVHRSDRSVLVAIRPA